MKLSLKAARVNKRLTQIEAAEKLGVTPDTISNWERGKSVPDVIMLKKIEKLYDISYNELIFIQLKSV